MRPGRLHFTSTIIITVAATAIIAAVTTPFAVLLILVFHTIVHDFSRAPMATKKGKTVYILGKGLLTGPVEKTARF